MAREGKDFDDEIDLVALVLLFWGYRGKFAALGIAGLILGLAFTYQHAPRYATDFKVALGHPIYSEALLVGSTGMQRLLDETNYHIYILDGKDSEINGLSATRSPLVCVPPGY